MKRAFLLMVVPALLVALGFAQTPAASINTDQTKIKGCLAGSDGNYTVVEDNTGHIYKITTSSADLKPHVGHDVALIGHKASGASSAAGDNGFAVTELNMISEHCAAAARARWLYQHIGRDYGRTRCGRCCARCYYQRTGRDCRHACGGPSRSRCHYQHTGGDSRHTPCGRGCARCHCHHTCRNCRHACGPGCSRCHYQHTGGDGCHTSCGRCCARCYYQHTCGDGCHTRCRRRSPNATASPFSETVSNTVSHRHTGCDCRHVLGECQHTRCRCHYTRNDC